MISYHDIDRVPNSSYATYSLSEASPPPSFSHDQDIIDTEDPSRDWIPSQHPESPIEALLVSGGFESNAPANLYTTYASIQSQFAPEEPERCNLFATSTSLDTNTSGGGTSSLLEPSHLGLNGHPSTFRFGYLSSSSIVTDTSFDSSWGSHPSIGSLSPTIDDEHTLVDYYNRHLSSFFTMRPPNSTWNFYSYAIRSTDCQLDSPLRHSILAWASAHLMLKGHGTSNETRGRHYARARSAVNDLLMELEVEASAPCSSKSVSKKLNMLLLTSLFLSYCDVVSGDNMSLGNGLLRLRELLQSSWEFFRGRLGPLESRILVWLSYLDLRSGFWRAIETPVSSVVPMRAQGHSSDRYGLFSFLVDQRGISSLRANPGGRYFLSECFGSSYPEQVLKDDLQQEPAKFLSDDAVAIFGTILDFEDWDDTTASKCPDHVSLIQELRSAKIQAIRANIARVRAVRPLHFPPPANALSAL